MSKYITIPPEKIVSWVSANFPDHKTRKDGTELIISNPFDGDTGYHFNISVRGVCHDWRGADQWAPLNPRTGKHSSTFLNFVRLYRKCSWQQAAKEVLGSNAYLSTKPRKELEVKDEVQEIKLPTGSVPIIDSPEPIMASLVVNWLKSRGVILAQIAEHKMHHMTSDVVWPYYEYGILVYWQSRSVLTKRFLFPPKDVANKDYFYGFDSVEPASYVVITEAIFGALTLGVQALASGGASMSEKLVRKLALLDPVDGVILAPDNDKAGINSILHNVPLIRGLKCKPFYSLPPRVKIGVDDAGKDRFSKDWNDLVAVMSKSEISDIMMRSIKPYTERSKFELARMIVKL